MLTETGSAPAAARDPTMMDERAVVLTVTFATMLAPLNSTMIAVALPRITADFGAGATGAGWLVTAYLIIMATLQPIAGKLGDQFGRRPLLLGGLAGFGLASAGAALAPNLPVLIALRALQALAGALALPNGVALLRELIPAGRRGGGAGRRCRPAAGQWRTQPRSPSSIAGVSPSDDTAIWAISRSIRPCYGISTGDTLVIQLS
ncbi:MAG TPA: MFS transporter [Roseiflexaceae bacterium]|nr:MFS transporter [Roseiflexaceae bacterium]